MSPPHHTPPQSGDELSDTTKRKVLSMAESIDDALAQIDELRTLFTDLDRARSADGGRRVEIDRERDRIIDVLDKLSEQIGELRGDHATLEEATRENRERIRQLEKGQKLLDKKTTESAAITKRDKTKSSAIGGIAGILSYVAAQIAHYLATLPHH